MSSLYWMPGSVWALTNLLKELEALHYQTPNSQQFGGLGV